MIKKNLYGCILRSSNSKQKQRKKHYPITKFSGQPVFLLILFKKLSSIDCIITIQFDIYFIIQYFQFYNYCSTSRKSQYFQFYNYCNCSTSRKSQW